MIVYSIYLKYNSMLQLPAYFAGKGVISGVEMG
jgi:hypothetical protein